MTDKLWKATERTIANRLGGERVGCTGAATPDVVTDRLAVEVKTRNSLPDWLSKGLAQADTNASDDKVPVLILHETGTRHDMDMCVMWLSDFEKLIEGEGADVQA